MDAIQDQLRGKVICRTRNKHTANKNFQSKGYSNLECFTSINSKAEQYAPFQNSVEIKL